MANDKTLQQRFTEAWGNIENPDLDGENPHFKNRYATLRATLASVRAACKPLGIAYVQALKQDGDGFTLRSYVIDGADGFMPLSEFPVENVPNAQAFGSEMTYKKRQQAQADWGIVGEEDDDGEAITASQKSRAAKGAQKTKTAQPRANVAASRQTAGRYDKLKELKAEALELGITEEGMNGAIANILKGKPMKEATDTELRACEGCIAGLIRDKHELLVEQGLEDGNVG